MGVSLVITSAELIQFGEMAQDQTIVVWLGLPQGLGAVIWLFYVHSEALLVYQMMDDRSQWYFSVIFAMCGSVTVMLIIAILGYGSFGEEAQQCITGNIGRDLDLQLIPGVMNNIISVGSAVIVALKQLTGLPLTVAPIMIFMEDQIHVADPIKLMLWAKILIRAIFMAVTTFICLVLQDQLVRILELSGALLQTCIVIILPCASLLKLKGVDMGPLQRSLLWACLLAAALYAVGGTTSILV